MRAAPVGDSRVVFVTGTGLSHEPATRGDGSPRRPPRGPPASRSSSTSTTGRINGTARRHFAQMRAAAVGSATIAVGTEEEVAAAAGTTTICRRRVDLLLRAGLDADRQARRRAARPSSRAGRGAACDVPSFPIEVLNVLGAGDAFASGFI